jgi:hypothetical protein
MRESAPSHYLHHSEIDPIRLSKIAALERIRASRPSQRPSADESTAVVPKHEPEKQRMDRSRLLCSPIAVATVVDADAHAVAAAAGELHGPERSAIGARPQRRTSSPACRMMDRVVVVAYRGWIHRWNRSYARFCPGERSHGFKSD